MSDRSEPSGASRRDVLKSGAIGVGALAGIAGASAMHPAAADAATPAAVRQTAGPDNYFLKLDGVPGDSTNAAHKGEIELLAFSWGVSNSGGGATGTGAGGHASFSDFNFTATTSKASPLLMLNTASGKHIPSALVTVSRRIRGGSQDFIKIELTDVLIASYEQSAGGGATPLDSASLSYAKIKYSVLSQSANGAPGTTTTTGWDIKANKQI